MKTIPEMLNMTLGITISPVLIRKKLSYVTGGDLSLKKSQVRVTLWLYWANICIICIYLDTGSEVGSHGERTRHDNVPIVGAVRVVSIRAIFTNHIRLTGTPRKEIGRSLIPRGEKDVIQWLWLNLMYDENRIGLTQGTSPFDHISFHPSLT